MRRCCATCLVSRRGIAVWRSLLPPIRRFPPVASSASPRSTSFVVLAPRPWREACSSRERCPPHSRLNESRHFVRRSSVSSRSWWSPIRASVGQALLWPGRERHCTPVSHRLKLTQSCRNTCRASSSACSTSAGLATRAAASCRSPRSGCHRLSVTDAARSKSSCSKTLTRSAWRAFICDSTPIVCARCRCRRSVFRSATAGATAAAHGSTTRVHCWHQRSSVRSTP